MDTNILNLKRVSVRWWLYVLSNTFATLEAKSMKKFSNTEAELKKSVAYKKKLYILYSVLVIDINVNHYRLAALYILYYYKWLNILK